MAVKAWITAFRLRTLPLALACVSMGAFLAASSGTFSLSIFLFCCLTTLLLQILSNLANDYGDFVNGADVPQRQGPVRMVQSGAISPLGMKRGVLIFSVLSLSAGLFLLWTAFGSDLKLFLIFFGIGLLAILAAIAYTIGKRPYGYAGLGDISVLIFLD